VDDFGPGFIIDEDTPLILANVLANDISPRGTPLFIESYDTSALLGLLTQDAPGSLDPTFDGDGKVTTDFFGSGGSVRALAVQPDGKIIAAGGANSGDGSTSYFALARYNSDGSLDTSFDDDGMLTTDFFGRVDGATALVVQPDGKFVAAGFTDTGSDWNFALARYDGGHFFYNPNGQFEYLSAGEVATDTFTYVVSDGWLTDTATVSITVIGVNEAPLAEGVDEGVELTANLREFGANRANYFYPRMARMSTNFYKILGAD
jgi:uncharacterized delta-60 repeat protein